MEKGPEPGKTQADPNIVVSKTAFPKARVVGSLVALVVVAAVVGVSFWLAKMHNDHAGADDVQSRQTLVKELKNAVNQANNPSIIGLSSQLIDGAKRYKLNNNDLGWYYVDRANAYLSTNHYKLAAPDFAKAASLNSELTMAAYQGEFEARYKSGERDQLIPLLQNIVQLEKQSKSPIHGMEVDAYQQDIKDIQQGKEIDF